MSQPVNPAPVPLPANPPYMYGYPQQPPLNHDGAIPSSGHPSSGIPPQQGARVDDLVSSMSSMALSNVPPVSQAALNAPYPTQPAQAYTYAPNYASISPPSNDVSAPSYYHNTLPTSPPQGYPPAITGAVRSTTYAPTGPPAQVNEIGSKTAIACAPTSGYAVPIETVSQQGQSSTPYESTGPIPAQQPSGPLVTSQQVAGTYAQSFPPYASIPPPPSSLVGPAAAGPMQNYPQATSNPPNTYRDMQPHNPAQGDPVAPPIGYWPNQPNSNAPAGTSGHYAQYYGEAQPSTSSGGAFAPDEANKGAAADYYGSSVPTEAPYRVPNASVASPNSPTEAPSSSQAPPFHPSYAIYPNNAIPPSTAGPVAYPDQPPAPYGPLNTVYTGLPTPAYNQNSVPQPQQSVSPGESTEAGSDEAAANGERGLGSLLLGGKGKRGLLGVGGALLAGIVSHKLSGGSNHHAQNNYAGYGNSYDYGYGYDGSEYANQGYDASAFAYGGGFAPVGVNVNPMQTMMDYSALNAQAIADTGSKISNLC